MLTLSEETPVYIFSRAIDMRGSFDRLSSVVKEECNRSVLQGGLFVFFSRRKDRVKILYWDRDGYCLWYKRLEADVFQISLSSDGKQEEITGVELKELLSGISFSRIKLRKNAEKGLYA